MIIKLGPLALQLRRPVVLLSEAKYELTLRLPAGATIRPISVPDGYRIREFKDWDKRELARLYRKCGFDFSDSALDEVLSICLPGGLYLVERADSEELVSTMMARHLSSREFPFGGRIDWLASDPDCRGKGLGRLSATLARNHLIRMGYQNIWVTTQAHRLDAINIFLSLGFVPTDRTLREYPWAKIKQTIATSEKPNLRALSSAANEAGKS